MVLRALRFDGRISTMRTQRGSVIGMSFCGRYQTSWWFGAILYSDDLMIRSGGPKPSFTACHSLSLAMASGLGMSFGSPCGAPASTHATIVSICFCVSDMSFLNFCTPTLWSMCHGGICRVDTRFLIERAHGRDSANV